MLFDIEILLNSWGGERRRYLRTECQISQNSTNSPLCNNPSDFIADVLDIIWIYCLKSANFKPAVCLLISSFSTSIIIYKRAKQARFQLKHNRRDFINSARIAIVIAAQTLINLVIFVFQFFSSFPLLVTVFAPSARIITIKNYVEGKNYTGYIDFRFPLWIDDRLGLTGAGGKQIITQSRIFIESIIVLCIMTGYREAIVKFAKNLFFFIRHPQQFVRKFKSTPQTSWTRNL